MKLKADRQEIEQHLELYRSKVELSTDPEVKQLNQRHLAVWENHLKLYDLRSIERRERAFEKRMQGKSAEWHQWAKSLYIIEPTAAGYRVRSTAKEWKEEKSWNVSVRIDAEERVEKLINFKVKDRERGRGDVDKDLNKA